MDRTDAGRHLARSLERLRGSDVVVLGLPRGGVPVAFEVARALGAPLDVIVVRKLGVPYQPELAMGAIGEGGIRVSNDEVIRRGGITGQEIAAVEERERADLDQQAAAVPGGPAARRGRRAHRGPRRRRDRDRLDRQRRLPGGQADGRQARSSWPCRSARRSRSSRCGMSATRWSASYAPEFFMAVGTFYDDFRHVSDHEVIDLLAGRTTPCRWPPRRAPAPRAAASQPRGGTPRQAARRRQTAKNKDTFRNEKPPADRRPA